MTTNNTNMWRRVQESYPSHSGGMQVLTTAQTLPHTLTNFAWFWFTGCKRVCLFIQDSGTSHGVDLHLVCGQDETQRRASRASAWQVIDGRRFLRPLENAMQREAFPSVFVLKQTSCKPLFTKLFTAERRQRYLKSRTWSYSFSCHMVLKSHYHFTISMYAR